MKECLPDIDTLEAAVAERNPVDYEKAKKFWGKGKKEEGFKILQHMITATVVTKELRRKAEAARNLSLVTLSLQNLQTLVREGRDDGDRNWLSLSWSEVEIAHRARIEGGTN